MNLVLGLGSRVPPLGSQVSGPGCHPQDGSRVSDLGSHQKSRVSGPTFLICLQRKKITFFMLFLNVCTGLEYFIRTTHIN